MKGITPEETIDALLAEVGMSTAGVDEDWVRKPHHYIEEAVDDAHGETLVRAYSALFGHKWEGTPEPWEPGRLRLFVSHSSIDKASVSTLAKKLATYGVDTFVAHGRTLGEYQYCRSCTV